MDFRTSVIVTFEFEGFHCWKDAPPEHYYLSLKHRHLFKVRAEKEVDNDSDRQIEIIAFKKRMRIHCENAFQQAEGFSCETIAAILLETFGLLSCEVMEDGENGARVWKIFQ